MLTSKSGDIRSQSSLLIKFFATAEFEFSSFPHKDFTIDIFLRQQWTDKRLDHGLNHTITLSSRWAMKKIWVPDSYFVNAKTGRMHRVTTPNMMLMLGPGGVIKYNARYFSQICLLLAFYQWRRCEVVVITKCLERTCITERKKVIFVNELFESKKCKGLNNGRERTNILSLMWGLEFQNFRDPSLDLTLSRSVLDHQTTKWESLTTIFGETRIYFFIRNINGW